MKKILIAAVLAGMTGGAYAAEFSDLAVRASDLKASFGLSAARNDIRVPAPSLAAPGPASRATGQQQGEDTVVDSLTEAQWDSILGSQPWEAAAELAVSKELYSDYHVRYIAKGQVSFRTTPPTFTTENGKVFVVTKYPKWLKEVGDTKICVEGYAKQRDDTSEFVIRKMLPPSALEAVMPSADMQNLQRDPFIISRDEAGYRLGNVNWNLAHAADGARVKDQYGNFISEWQSGVVVKSELLEAAYFVKKTSLKPVRYGDHGYLMFKFKPGGVMAADGKTTRFVVVSLDAYYKDQSNMSYSAVTALKRQYLVYYSIQTAERYTEFKLSEDPQSLTVYPLALTRGQRLQLLDNAFKKATDNNKGEAYSLFYNSCANSAVSLINSVLEGDKKIKAGWLPEIIYRARTTFPDAIAAVLLKKGIVSRPLPEITGANYQYAYDF